MLSLEIEFAFSIYSQLFAKLTTISLSCFEANSVKIFTGLGSSFVPIVSKWQAGFVGLWIRITRLWSHRRLGLGMASNCYLAYIWLAFLSTLPCQFIKMQSLSK